MPNYDPTLIGALANIHNGVRVDRATATLPQTTNAAIFNVNVGRVVVWMILGEVTTIIQNQLNNTKLTGVPTTGTAVDLCTITDIANLEVGGKLSIAGALATALVKNLAGAEPMQTVGIVVSAGTINLNCAASNTGSVKWSIWYTPIDDGANVTAA